VPDFYVIPSTAVGLPITAANDEGAVDTAIDERGTVPNGFYVAVLVDQAQHWEAQVEQTQPARHRRVKSRRGRVTPADHRPPV
jgi:hypothetical protein